MLNPLELWPRLASDAVYLPSRQGAYFRNDGTSFELDEQGTYELMRRLAPALTGRQSLERICAFCEPGERERIVRLVRALHARGIVRDERRRHDTVLPEIVRTRFASSIAILDHLSDTPEEAFARFRASRVLVVGFGETFRRCLIALIRNGLEHLWYLPTGAGDAATIDPESPAPLDTALETEAEALRRAGLSVELRRPRVTGDGELADVGDVSLIVCVADAVSLLDLVMVSRWASRESCLVIPAFLIGPQSVMGPAVRGPGCATCALNRIVAELGEPEAFGEFARALVDGGGRLEPSFTGSHPLAERLGGDVAFETFKALAGHLRPEIERGLILQTIDERGPAHASWRACFVPYTLHGCTGFCRRFAPGDPRGLRAAAPSQPARLETAGPVLRPCVPAPPC